MLAGDREGELREETRHGSKKVCGCDGGDGGIKLRRIKLEQRALFGRISGRV